MKTLFEYILERKLISFKQANTNYGQCIILAGGAASGKGFIQSRINAQGKVFDVDELKQKYMKLTKISKLASFKDDYDYDLSNPADTAKLHQKIKDIGLKNKERSTFWKSAGKANKNTLPNVIFDMVSDDINDIIDISTKAKANGYEVTLVWVVCNKDTAIMSNAVRGIDANGKARSVPQEILDKGHEGAYKTITNLLNNKYKTVNMFIDNVWIGFSAGWGRMLNKTYENDPVIKVKKNINNFEFNQAEIDTFLKEQQPINYDIDDKTHISLASYRDGKRGEWGVKKYEYFIKHAEDFDETKMPEQ